MHDTLRLDTSSRRLDRDPTFRITFRDFQSRSIRLYVQVAFLHDDAQQCVDELVRPDLSRRMHHSANTPFHLRKLLGHRGIFNQPAISDHAAIFTVIPLHLFKCAFKTNPGFIRHGGIESLPGLETNLLEDTFSTEELLECNKMSHFVLDQR